MVENKRLYRGITQRESASLTSWKSWVQIPLPLPNSKQGGHQDGIGEASKTTKRRYKIIEGDKCFYVKKRFGPLYLYVRTNIKKLRFDTFHDVVIYVIEQKRNDREH